MYTDRERNRFVDGYVTAMLWAETIFANEGGPDPRIECCDCLLSELDGQSFEQANFSGDDVSPESMQEIEKDCDAFLASNWRLIEATSPFGSPNRGWTHYEQAGHDFYLTRNGHGCGFWDRGYPDRLGDALTKRAKEYGTQGLYLGDDGKCYTHG
jgi:hypothetical protein